MYHLHDRGTDRLLRDLEALGRAEPLVDGGQGRTAAETRDTAEVLWVFFGGFLLGALIGAVLALALNVIGGAW